MCKINKKYYYRHFEQSLKVKLFSPLNLREFFPECDWARGCCFEDAGFSASELSTAQGWSCSKDFRSDSNR